MVKVKVPATSANLGPGFDTLGMALDLHNIIEMCEIPGGLHISVSGAGKEAIPIGPTNVVYQAAMLVFQQSGYQPKGLAIRIHNHIPIARGLGSSAAAIVGGLVAANELAGRKLPPDVLVELGTGLEGHPDNVGPALLGGVVIAAKLGSGICYRKLEPPKDLQMVLAVPKFGLPTKVAREALPKSVSFADAVYNLGRSSLLVLAFASHDLDLLGQVMEDRLHQPYRSSLVPGMENVFMAAKGAGALGVALSGAGPTLVAFCRGDQQLAVVGEAMWQAFASCDVEAEVKFVKPCASGAEVIG